MDILRFHKSAAVRGPSSPTGAETRFLPPDSPDCNPIENAFAKAFLRKAEARTRELLWTALAEAIKAFTPPECTNYFAAAGHETDR